MGDSVESLAEVEVDSIHCSPLIYPASHTIVGSYQIGQAWFPLGESMLIFDINDSMCQESDYNPRSSAAAKKIRGSESQTSWTENNLKCISWGMLTDCLDILVNEVVFLHKKLVWICVLAHTHVFKTY